MGKQTNLYYVGTRRNLVYYQLNGGYYVRTKPALVRQTLATRACAGHFGTAVKISKAFRDSLAPLLPPANKRQMAFRLNTVLYQWLLSERSTAAALQAVPALQDFQFNPKTSLKERLKPALQVQWKEEGEALIAIAAFNPAKDVAAPAHTLGITLHLALATCNLDDFTITSQQAAVINIPYSNAPVAAQHIHMPWNPGAGRFSIVTASLRYQVQQQYAVSEDGEEDWQPAAIVEALWQPGETGN